MNVKFKFDIGDRVHIKPHDVTGIVDTLTYNRDRAVGAWVDYRDGNGRVQSTFAKEDDLELA